ncbi:hypothetical protein OSCI_3080009 [Kamptonema sp. PCC 6506]|nr:hypothetical protein OSCI_3080009 [Kamptonema sp. PCC 6506]
MGSGVNFYSLSGVVMIDGEEGEEEAGGRRQEAGGKCNTRNGLGDRKCHNCCGGCYISLVFA